MKKHFVLDGELTHWAHTSRFDRGPPCTKYENHYDRGPFPLFRLFGGVEVPVTSLVAIVGSARYEDSSWESTDRHVSALAGVRYALK